MQTQTFNAEPPTDKPSFLNVIVVAIVGSIMLFSGFIMSLFLLAVSAILFPFVAFKIWLLQKQIKENMQSDINENTVDSDSVIEGEYKVSENTKDDQ